LFISIFYLDTSYSSVPPPRGSSSYPSAEEAYAMAYGAGGGGESGRGGDSRVASSQSQYQSQSHSQSQSTTDAYKVRMTEGKKKGGEKKKTKKQLN
jgi:hypothetical protein